MATVAEEDLEAYLARFGLSSFRPGQREVISTVLAGKDCLCVMPTGGGKSLCYQLPALVAPGITLVVSPLIALMKDQVDALAARGMPATFINSTLSPEEQSARLQAMTQGEYRLVYVVPERFRSSRFIEALRRSQVRLLAIDEAHCVSEWGHDFRPDYARLGRFRGQLGNPPTIALTATATDSVRRDIVELLSLRDPQLFITGFARPNLFYSVRVCSSDRDKDEALFRLLAETPGSGIVYASTRKRCEEVAERITARTRRSSTVYHAGLTGDQRRTAQEDFMQGRSQIAVATMAFGMGIDKADVRFVVHYNLPGSLEAYYQEAGRAGRDGQPAKCLLLASGADRYIHEFFIESAYPSRDVVRRVYDFLRELGQNPIEMTQQEIKEALGLQIGSEGIGACEKLLETAGVLERLEAAENTAAVRLASDLPTLVDLLPQQARVKRQVLRAVERLVGGRRQEWYYFQPRELLRELTDFDSTSLSRNLRELSSLTAFDYVPPFRGRAIHIRQRGQRFTDLEIDFETLERRKSAELERIERVLSFARNHRCRQQHILQYFGEADAQACGHCDNCHSAASADTSVAAPATGAVLDAVRIVLSGVARISRVRKGCGKQLLAQMLCGSNAKSVTRNRLDKLSTFGLLGTWKQPEVVQLIDALLIGGLLEQTEIEPFRPVLQLTERGTEVMGGRDDAPVNLPLPDEVRVRLGLPTTASPAAAGAEAPVDRELVARLRKWRETISKAQSIPAYLVMSNAVLDELARVRPQSATSLGAVKGIGPAKVRQYGDALLEMLAQHSPSVAVTSEPAEVAEESAPEDSDALWHRQTDVRAEAAESHKIVEPHASEQSPSGATQSPAQFDQSSHYWTWRLLAAGFSPDECATIRDLAPEVVLDHALRAADAGHPVDAAWFLAPALVQQIEQLVGPGVPTRIRRLLEQLPRGTRYEHVQLVLKTRAQRAGHLGGQASGGVEK